MPQNHPAKPRDNLPATYPLPDDGLHVYLRPEVQLQFKLDFLLGCLLEAEKATNQKAGLLFNPQIVNWHFGMSKNFHSRPQYIPGKAEEILTEPLDIKLNEQTVTFRIKPKTGKHGWRKLLCTHEDYQLAAAKRVVDFFGGVIVYKNREICRRLGKYSPKDLQDEDDIYEKITHDITAEPPVTSSDLKIFKDAGVVVEATPVMKKICGAITPGTAFQSTTRRKHGR